MSIYYCNSCKHVQEVPLAGQTTCGKCHNAVNAYEATSFVQHLINQLISAKRELHTLKTQFVNDSNTSEIAGGGEQSSSNMDDVNFSDTGAFANEEQHRPLASWLTRQGVEPIFDYDAVDMRGFYDEAAVMLGNNYELFAKLLGQIGFAYRKNHTGLNIDLNKYSQKDGQTINQICSDLYKYTLFSNYFYQKKDKVIRLKLQKTVQVQQFFTGGWLEWYALSKMLSALEKRNKRDGMAVAHNAKVRFTNGDLHELDVMFYLVGSQPMVIECKTGEFRQDIDKYLRLQKQLKLPANHFIMLCTEISPADARILNGMYDLSFVSLKDFDEFIGRMI